MEKEEGVYRVLLYVGKNFTDIWTVKFYLYRAMRETQGDRYEIYVHSGSSLEAAQSFAKDRFCVIKTLSSDTFKEILEDNPTFFSQGLFFHNETAPVQFNELVPRYKLHQKGIPTIVVIIGEDVT